MTLTFQLFGHELWRITLDIEQAPVPHVASAVERGVKAVSRAWIKRMVTS